MLGFSRSSRRYGWIVLLLSVVIVSATPDTYPKNPYLDVLNYTFELVLSDETDEIEAVATIDIYFKKDDLEEIRLDLINQSDELEGKGMEVSGVWSGSQRLAYTHRDDALYVRFPEPSSADHQIQIRISYSGIPATGLQIGPNKYGDRTFFSDNWPNRARNWLPTIDHPYDKATSDFMVTAPDHYQVVSNGLLVEKTNLENGMRFTHWKQSVPIATWLYALAVADFAVQRVDTFDGKEIQTWVYRQDRDPGFYDFALPSKHVLEFYSDYVGPYAYEKLANIQSNSVGGGMEAASAIFYGDNSVTGERTVRWRNVIIHEIAHQWFGNAVTEYDWDDVWLSEGFATFFTLLFREHAYGHDDYELGLKQARDRVHAYYEEHPDYRIVHDNLSDMRQVSSGQTYQKGAWILHMLRVRMGEDAFQTGIRNYYSAHYNGTATTDDFRRFMESASGGEDLQPFFSQWLYQGGFPVLEVKWSYDNALKNLSIEVSQVQSDGYLFELPVELGIEMAGTDELMLETILSKAKSSTSVTVPLDARPVRVIVDPKTKLLARWTAAERE